MTMFLKVKSQKQNADLLVNFLGRSCFLKLVNMSRGLQDESNFFWEERQAHFREILSLLYSVTRNAIAMVTNSLTGTGGCSWQFMTYDEFEILNLWLVDFFSLSWHQVWETRCICRFFFPVSHLKRANVILQFEGSLKYFGCHSQFKAAPLIIRLTHNVR